MYDKKLLHILLDSGSTHNFLDLELAKKLGCKPLLYPSLQVVDMSWFILMLAMDSNGSCSKIPSVLI